MQKQKRDSEEMALCYIMWINKITEIEECLWRRFVTIKYTANFYCKLIPGRLRRCRRRHHLLPSFHLLIDVFLSSCFLAWHTLLQHDVKSELFRIATATKTCKENKYSSYFKPLMKCPSFWTGRSKVASNDAKIALIDDVNVIYEWKFLTNNSKFVRAQKVCCKYSMIWFVVKHKNDKWIRPTGKFLAKSNNLTCDLNNLWRCRFCPPKSRSLSFNLLDSMAYVLDAVNIGSITSWRFILCSFVVVVGCHRFERRAQRTVMKHSTSIARLGNASCSAMYRMIQKLVVEAHVSWHSRLLS